jgi:hypothetical protein
MSDNKIVNKVVNKIKKKEDKKEEKKYLDKDSVSIQGLYHNQMRNMMVISSISFVLFNFRKSFASKFSYVILLLSASLLIMSAFIAYKASTEYNKRFNELDLNQELKKDMESWLYFPKMYFVVVSVILSIILLRKVF